MTRSRKVQPTPAELAILRVLWTEGPSSVRQVHESLGGDKRTRYTTTLKQLQVMAEKGLVRRDESRRSHVYAAAVKEKPTQQAVVGGFVDRMFGGSVQKLVIHALEAKDVSEEELAEIKRRLQEWENQR